MFVVTGATGNTGSVVANALLDRGQPVRLFVRNPQKVAALAARGAEVVTGDLFDPAALERVASGARGIYFVSPPDMQPKDFLAERKPLLEQAAAALGRSKVPHVVLLSSIGAQHPSGTGPISTLYAAEQALRRAGVDSTFIRAGFFLENWAGVLGAAKKDGVLPTFLPAALQIAMVDTQDIGRLAARTLIEGARGTRVLELGGPVDVSPNEVAAALGRILLRPVQAVEAPLDAVVPTFTSFGISTNLAELYREMYGALIAGKAVRETSGTQRVLGEISLEQSLRRLLG